MDFRTSKTMFFLKVLRVVVIIVCVVFLLFRCQKGYEEVYKHEDAMFALAQTCIPEFYEERSTSLRILEKDEYGRYLFRAECSFSPPIGPESGFMIVQKEEDNMLYYYAECNPFIATFRR